MHEHSVVVGGTGVEWRPQAPWYPMHRGGAHPCSQFRTEVMRQGYRPSAG